MMMMLVMMMVAMMSVLLIAISRPRHNGVALVNRAVRFVSMAVRMSIRAAS